MNDEPLSEQEVSVRLEDLQAAANRAWRIHLLRCIAIALSLVIALIAEHRVLGYLAVANPPLIWGVILLYSALVVYTAEWTRHEWRQLQAIERFQSLPSAHELRIARSKEKLYYSILNAVFLSCVTAFIAWIMHSNKLLLIQFSMLPVIGLIAVFKAWRELRSSSSSVNHQYGT
jgi:hypothetical protein